MVQRVENPEVWRERLLDPLPGRARRVSARVVRQEADDFAELAARFGSSGG